MKKKVISLIAALACVSAGAVGLMACGGGDDYSGGIYLVRDGAELKINELGECTYMVDSEFRSIFNFTVCTKGSDGKFVELKDTDYTVKITCNGDVVDPAPQYYSDYNAGYYTVEYKYKDCSTSANFTVKKSDNTNYTAFVSKTDWKFGEEGATLSVYDNDGSTLLTNEHDYSAWYISEADYNEIKDAADFKEQLSGKQQTYHEDFLSDMTPGVYYIFAKCTWTTNYHEAYSDFKKVTVTKGDLTIQGANSISTESYSYANSGKIGNIKLSDINVDEGEAYAEDGFGRRVSGAFVWRDPDTNINSTNSGSKYWVSFVPSLNYRDYYNYEKANVLNAGQAEITVYKGFVNKPRYTNVDCGSDKFQGFGYDWTYDGEVHDVYVNSAYHYDEYVDVTRGEQKMNDVTNDNYGSIIDHVTNAGTYVYTLSLKDPVNYYWKNYGINSDEADQTDTANITFTFILNPMNSYIENRRPLVPDKNGVIKLPITPYATPYEAGTLTVAKNNEENDHTLDNVNVSIVPENGVDYLVISNFISENYPQNLISELPLKLTATGKDNYEDIDWEVTYYIEYIVTTSIDETTNLKVYKGTAASVLYDYYPTLKTTAGDYKLYIVVGGEDYPVSDDNVLEEVGEHNFKLVFDSSNIDVNIVAVQKASVEFKITCVEFDCPIAANERIEVAAGTNISNVLADYNLQNQYGQWYFERQTEDGDWVTDIGGFEIPAGETKCRLYFQSNGSLAGTPSPVEFTIVGTN